MNIETKIDCAANVSSQRGYAIVDLTEELQSLAQSLDSDNNHILNSCDAFVGQPSGSDSVRALQRAARDPMAPENVPRALQRGNQIRAATTEAQIMALTFDHLKGATVGERITLLQRFTKMGNFVFRDGKQQKIVDILESTPAHLRTTLAGAISRAPGLNDAIMDCVWMVERDQTKAFFTAAGRRSPLLPESSVPSFGVPRASTSSRSEQVEHVWGASEWAAQEVEDAGWGNSVDADEIDEFVGAISVRLETADSVERAAIVVVLDENIEALKASDATVAPHGLFTLEQLVRAAKQDVPDDAIQFARDWRSVSINIQSGRILPILSALDARGPAEVKEVEGTLYQRCFDHAGTPRDQFDGEQAHLLYAMIRGDSSARGIESEDWESDGWSLVNNDGLAWSDSPDGNYEDNANTSLTSPPIVVPAGGGVLAFDLRYELEEKYDELKILVGLEDETWDEYETYRGSGENAFATVDLSEHAGKSVRVKFQITSDGSNTYDGAQVSDFMLIESGE